MSRVGRRTVLSGLSAGVLGALAGCASTGTPVPTSTTTTAPPPSTSTAPRAPDWVALRERLGGRLVLPGDATYDTVRLPYNQLFDGNRPAAVATCRSAADVQACVAEARATGLPVAARSGGHSYAGYSTVDGGLVVDLAGAAEVRPNPDGSVTVGAGARLIDVYAGLAGAGRLLPAGSCPTVGIAGLTLGGGIGVLSRAYGLTCDRLVSAEVVTADATVRTAAEDADADLFWGLRGGGGGNFGIVTSFTFSTEEAADLTVFSLRFGAGSVPAVLGAWQDWIARAPRELWSNCVISAGATPTCRVGGCLIGSTQTANGLIADLRMAVGTTPTSTLVRTSGYLDAMRYFAGCSQRSVRQCHPVTAGGQLGRESFVATSAILAGPADPAKVAALLTGRSGMDLLLDSLGGAVSDMDAAATAFPHRTALASAQLYANAAAADAERVRAAVGEVRTGLTAFTGPSGYVNYIDPAVPDWAAAYYGGNAGRLADIAAKYDPDAVFRFAQSVHS